VGIIGQAATLMFALNFTLYPIQWCGDYTTANMQCGQLVALAGEKGAFVWKVLGKLHQSCLLTLTGNASASIDHLRNHGISVSGSHIGDAMVFVVFGEGLCGAWPIRLTLGASLAKQL